MTVGESALIKPLSQLLDRLHSVEVASSDAKKTPQDGGPVLYQVPGSNESLAGYAKGRSQHPLSSLKTASFAIPKVAFWFTRTRKHRAAAPCRLSEGQVPRLRMSLFFWHPKSEGRWSGPPGAVTSSRCLRPPAPSLLVKAGASLRVAGPLESLVPQHLPQPRSLECTFALVVHNSLRYTTSPSAGPGARDRRERCTGATHRTARVHFVHAAAKRASFSSM